MNSMSDARATIESTIQSSGLIISFQDQLAERKIDLAG